MTLFDSHAKISLFFLSVLLGPLLAVLILIPIDEGATASGQLALEHRHLDIQTDRLAEIQELLVAEGEAVIQGQNLLSLAAPEAAAALKTAQLESLAARAVLARLQVEEGAESKFAFAELDQVSEHRNMVAEQRSQAETNLNARVAERAQIQALISAARAQVSAVLQREANLVQRLDLRVSALNRTAALVDDGVLAITALQEAEDALLAAQSQLDSLRQDQLSMGQQLTNAEVSLTAFETRVRAQRQVERSAASAQLARAGQEETKWTTFLERQIIRAPHAGVVQGIDQLSGHVIAPGQVLFRLVPQDARFHLAAEFSAIDGDRVRQGMDVLFTIPALVDQNIGPLVGTIQTIDQTARFDGDGRPLFKASISISSQAQEIMSTTRARAGMATEISLLSGRRTLLAYLVAPVKRSFRAAIREE